VLQEGEDYCKNPKVSKIYLQMKVFNPLGWWEKSSLYNFVVAFSLFYTRTNRRKSASPVESNHFSATNTSSWWFQIFFYFHPYLGNVSHFD